MTIDQQMQNHDWFFPAIGDEYTDEQITGAIEAEAKAWAEWSGTTDEQQIEARRSCMRANVKCGFIDPLLSFLEPEAQP